jgi:hypothetical protein
LASPCLHAMFSGGKSGEEKLRRFFSSLWKSFSLSLSLSGFCLQVLDEKVFFFCKPLGLCLVLGWWGYSFCELSFLPFVQIPEKDNESEEDNGELILTTRWEDEEHGTKKKQQLWWERERERELGELAFPKLFQSIMPKKNYG